MPYISRLFLFRVHLNVDIAAAVNRVSYVYKDLYKGPHRSRCTISAYQSDESIEDALNGIIVTKIFASMDPTVMVLPVQLEAHNLGQFERGRRRRAPIHSQASLYSKESNRCPTRIHKRAHNYSLAVFAYVIPDATSSRGDPTSLLRRRVV